jgi:uncharacterized membrane protein
MTGNGWIDLALAFAFFLVSHAVPARPPVRRALAGRIGERAYLIAYSLVSMIALGLLIAAAGRAPCVELWSVREWQTSVPQLVMPFVCLLIAFALAAPNPLSFGGAAPHAFDPNHPGIAGVARHPLLLALALWSLAHLVPNGDLAHVLVFGPSSAFALAGMLMIDRRKKKQWGDAEWSRLAARTSLLPFAALLRRRWRPDLSRLDGGAAVRFIAAIILYLALIAAHEPLIGVAATPGSWT